MSKHVAYSAITGQILQWQDTESFHYAAPPDHVEIQTVTDEQWSNQASFGWVDAGELSHIEPAQEIYQPCKEEAEIVNLARRDALLSEAAVIMAPLQDALDLNDASDSEQNALIAWKRYRVALNRIQEQEGFPLNVEWPVAPMNDIRPVRRNSP